MKSSTASVWIVLSVNIWICCSWKEWTYETFWTETSDLGSSSEEKVAWEQIWNNASFAPRPRRGHSLVLMDYEGYSYLVLFGGRDNNRLATHIPRTYNVKKENGSNTFTTYDQKPVNPCNDVNGDFYTDEQRKSCLNTTNYAVTTIGVFYNDVWAYKLCDIATNANQTGGHKRYFDEPCVNEGWVVWHLGAREGGCSIELGVTVCNVPSERYEHGAVAFKDGLMYVYGGYSQRCSDYCDDLWAFDVYLKNWKKIYAAGELSKLYADLNADGVIVEYTEAEVPRDNSTQHWAGPGARWKHSMVISDPYQINTTTTTDNNITSTSTALYQDVAIFGGHRLWHGFSSDNSEANDWNSYDDLPEGGYLEDFWIYTKQLDFDTVPGSNFKSSVGRWRKVLGGSEQTRHDYCSSSSGGNSGMCSFTSTAWPIKRANHGSAFDSQRHLIWLFGGYNSYYPYLSTDGVGSSGGVSAQGTGGFVPYTGYTYFLNDLWYYNLTSGTWTYVDASISTLTSTSSSSSSYEVPAARSGHEFLLVDSEVLLMHGGYADNKYFDDTWYFNISASRWLQKTAFRYPRYPKNCNDDEEYIQSHPNCTLLSWPKHVERDVNIPYDILPYSEQSYYWPDPVNGRYWAIEKDDNLTKLFFSSSVDSSTGSNNKNDVIMSYPVDGTPEFPFAATGLFQYVQKFIYSLNATHKAILVASCTSVYGEPTRGKLIDGLYGRANENIFIPQMRRQRPGWDGCRDRADERSELTAGLQYIKPLARAGHKAVYHPATREVFMYGGVGYEEEQIDTFADTWPTSTKADMWYFNINYCMNNCSYHGACSYGFCLCYPGYYGEDCSNITCPGSACYYDEFTFAQTCHHACQAGYNHSDDDVYVQDISKLPCSAQYSGESNGICDGFGNSQCAPPFVGDDCSIKDCGGNCSFNGWCSIEYPVSRCICHPGYFGTMCQNKTCLNNCSYPNGLCNTTSGECNCRMMYNPYNNTMPFHPWGGEDCSYLFAYSSAKRTYRHPFFHLFGSTTAGTTTTSTIASIFLWTICLSFAMLCFTR